MIIRQRSLTHILKSIKLLNFFLIAASLFILSFYSITLYKVSKITPLTLVKKEPDQEKPPLYDRSAIGRGALSLSSEIRAFPFPDLSGEILFLAKNTRPDATLEKMRLKIGLRGNPDSIEMIPNQKLYLSYDEKHLSFSKTVTPLWIALSIDSQGDFWLDMGIELINGEGEKLLNETRGFKVNDTWNAKKVHEISDPELKKGIDVIEKGKWWGPDKLFEEYGGEDYHKYIGYQRLEIESTKGKKLLFVRENETYIWKEDEWIRAAYSDGYPMGKVVSISPYKLEWCFWDTGGMESTLLSFKREKEGPIAIRIEDVFTRLRKRTSSRISCRIDNRAKILKEGDWLIHTNTGWHTIKNYYEVEALLNLEILGDLFIFDGIQVIEGKEIFAGTLFNPMRTEMKMVRLPFSQIKGGEHSPHTKNALSVKIAPLAQEENSSPEGRGQSSKKFETIEDLDLLEDD